MIKSWPKIVTIWILHNSAIIFHQHFVCQLSFMALWMPEEQILAALRNLVAFSKLLTALAEEIYRNEEWDNLRTVVELYPKSIMVQPLEAKFRCLDAWVSSQWKALSASGTRALSWLGSWSQRSGSSALPSSILRSLGRWFGTGSKVQMGRPRRSNKT